MPSEEPVPVQCHQRAARKRDKQLYRPRGALATRLTHAPSQAPSPSPSPSGANALRPSARPGRRGTAWGLKRLPPLARAQWVPPARIGRVCREPAAAHGGGAWPSSGKAGARPEPLGEQRRRGSSLCASAWDVPGGTDGDAALEPPPS